MTAGLRREFRRIVVAGAGGNIGSHLVPHLARLAGVSAVTLVDPDRYERRNLACQAVASADVGRTKVEVQAERMRRIDPAVEVRPLAELVERLPLGELRGTLVLSGLDSRRSRQYLNWATARLGAPWIDAGVDGSALLARVDVYVPGPDRPCMECLWSEEDYRLLEQSYPCAGLPGEPVATGAPSALGALAAALQALEARRFLESGESSPAGGRQIVLDARHHRLLRTRLTADPSCRLGDHRPWAIEAPGIPFDELVLSELAAGVGRIAGKPATWLRVEGRLFARRATCPGCGAVREGLWQVSGYAPEPFVCPRCGGKLASSGFDLWERLELPELSREEARSTLDEVGIRPGDVLTLGRHGAASRSLMVSDRR